MEALAEKNGITLNVGKIDAEDITPTFGAEDGPQPLEVGSRVVAHLMHRIPGIRKIEKRFEGKDSNAGIGSDLAALFGQLYARNKAEIDQLAGTAITDTLKGMVKPGKAVPPTQPGPTVPDFGVVQPTVVHDPNQNGGSSDA